MSTKVGLISLGCDKNLVDSEFMLGILKKHNYEITNNKHEADIIIINTCAFIEDAKQESIDTILEMAQLKKNGRCKYLIATGCLSQRYSDELYREIPELDAVIGTGDFNKIVEVIEALGSRDRIKLNSSRSFVDYDLNNRVRTYNFISFVKIAEGCNNCCTYCAIPKIRGPYKSRPMQKIKEEVEILINQGVKEINLVAQDTTSYGIDLYGKPMLTNLLKELINIQGQFLIRILYAYPTNIDDSLLDIIKSSKKIAKYLDIPLQHINDRILKLMGRPITSKSITNLINKIRNRLPEINLRTTFIVGFPTETDREFEELVEFIKSYKFDKVGAFRYSKEEGTLAAKLSPQIPEQIKHKRYDKLMKIQRLISKEQNLKFKNRILNVLVEGFDIKNKLYFGRAENDAPFVDGVVKIKSDNCEIGKFYPVKILKTYDYDLYGVICRDHCK